MNFSLIAYVLFCIIFGLTLVAALFRSDRTIGALLSLIILILIFTFYGLRWFSNKSSVIPTRWPPVINACPDYLVYYKRPNGQETCVDLLGINRSSGALRPWTQDMTPANPPSGNNYYFTGVYKPTMTTDQANALCIRAIQNGLTWEGITNGESCTYSAQ